MKQSKWLILALSLLTVSLLIAGCGKTDADPGYVVNDEPVPEETPAPEEELEPTIEVEPEEAEEENNAADLISDNPEADSYYYEYVVSIDGAEQVGFKIWSYDNRIRFEGGMEGETFYLDYNKKEGYLYMPAEKTMLKMPLESMDTDWDSPFMMTADIDDSAISGMNYIGDENVDGKECAVYEYDSSEGKVTYYIWKDEGIIIQMKMEMDGGSTYEYYFKDLKINENFEMELEIPDDVQIMG
ncbi:MAG: hypothetical protein K8R73_13125 [Clostridiales bacterium]|nr:hypothetical protein [Clostridiales bacterium]